MSARRRTSAAACQILLSRPAVRPQNGCPRRPDCGSRVHRHRQRSRSFNTRGVARQTAQAALQHQTSGRQVVSAPQAHDQRAVSEGRDHAADSARRCTLFWSVLAASLARRTIDLINRTFQLRTCDIEIDGKAPRPCLEYHIKRCLGPCVKGLCTRRNSIRKQCATSGCCSKDETRSLADARRACLKLPMLCTTSSPRSIEICARQLSGFRTTEDGHHFRKRHRHLRLLPRRTTTRLAALHDARRQHRRSQRILLGRLA